MTGQWDIDDARFRTMDHDFVWEANQDIRVPSSDFENSGIVAVTLDVDAQMDIVCCALDGTGHLVALERAIAALQTVRDGLTAMYQGHDDPGACLTYGDWGRCRSTHGHGEEHRFPTQAEYEQLERIGRPVIAS